MLRRMNYFKSVVTVLLIITLNNFANGLQQESRKLLMTRGELQAYIIADWETGWPKVSEKQRIVEVRKSLKEH